MVSEWQEARLLTCRCAKGTYRLPSDPKSKLSYKVLKRIYALARGPTMGIEGLPIVIVQPLVKALISYSATVGFRWGSV